jgi:peptide/nickel transport system substrate-binding protein
MDMAKKLIDESGLGNSITLQAPLQPDPVKQRAGQIFQAGRRQARRQGRDHAGRFRRLPKLAARRRDGLRPAGMVGIPARPGSVPRDPAAFDGSYAKFHGYSNPAMDKLLDAQRRRRTSRIGASSFARSPS